MKWLTAERIREMKRLSPAQKRCLLQSARGLTAQQAADETGHSVFTVRTALRDAQLTLGARNVVHAVVLALAAGEFTLEDVTIGGFHASPEPDGH